jgi:protein-S-isoprenylcysteine O-methyltransferase Ste14
MTPAALVAIVLLWYVPVIGTTTFVHVFIECWRAYGRSSYYIFTFVFGLILFGTALALPYVLPVHVSLPTPAPIAGVPLLALALAFLAWSYRTLTFRTLAWSPEVQRDPEPSGQFVARGPYRLCRHPVYSAALGIMVGAFLVSGILIIWFPVMMLLVLTRIEDRELQVRFGTSYELYAQHTPTLLWRITLRRSRKEQMPSADIRSS